MVWGGVSNSFAATPVAKHLQLNFRSKYQVGARYRCDFTAELFKLTRLKSSTDSSTRHRSLKAKLTGVMLITGVDTGKMITKCDFEVEQFTGTIDNEPIKSKLAGRRLGIDFINRTRAQFKIEGDKYLALSNYEQRLLALLFPAVLTENFTDLLGQQRKIAVGMTWQPPAKKFFSLFKQHGIKFSPDKVKRWAKISKYELFSNLKCLVVEEQLKTLNIPDFKFNFNMKLWFPISNPLGNACRIQRQAVWNASATLPGNGPLAIGHSVSTTVVNSLDFILIPLL